MKTKIFQNNKNNFIKILLIQYFLFFSIFINVILANLSFWHIIAVWFLLNLFIRTNLKVRFIWQKCIVFYHYFLIKNGRKIFLTFY
jgi:hypothetical protein